MSNSALMKKLMILLILITGSCSKSITPSKNYNENKYCKLMGYPDPHYGPYKPHPPKWYYKQQVHYRTKHPHHVNPY